MNNRGNVFNKCLICDYEELKDLPRYTQNHLCKCAGCGFVFSRLIPSEEELIEKYENYPRGRTISPITIKRYHKLLDSFEKFRKKNTLLDIGTGDGYFLEIAKGRGWNVFGTEYEEKAVNLCLEKGIKMHKGKLQIENYEKEMFDIITSFEVVEHINNPQEEVKNLNLLLRTGGIAYITTPNFNSVSRYLLKENWSIIDYPEHLCYYSPKTIKYLFNRFGFTNYKVETSGISVSRFRDSTIRKNTKPNPGTSNEIYDSILREKTEYNFFWKIAKKIINGVLNLTKTGDTLKASFIKKGTYL